MQSWKSTVAEQLLSYSLVSLHILVTATSTRGVVASRTVGWSQHLHQSAADHSPPRGREGCTKSLRPPALRVCPPLYTWYSSIRWGHDHYIGWPGWTSLSLSAGEEEKWWSTLPPHQHQEASSPPWVEEEEGKLREFEEEEEMRRNAGLEGFANLLLPTLTTVLVWTRALCCKLVKWILSLWERAVGYQSPWPLKLPVWGGVSYESVFTCVCVHMYEKVQSCRHT